MYRLNARDIKDTNHIYIGGIAGVVSIIKTFNPLPVIGEIEVRIEVDGNGYRSWALSALAFLFDQGLVIEKNLIQLGVYTGTDMGYRGKRVVLSRSKLNLPDFRKLSEYLISLDRSRKKKDRLEKVRLVNALEIYNEALLLNLNRTELYGQSDQSYLNFLRLLDGIVIGAGAWDFADKVIKILGDNFVHAHYKKIQKAKLYAAHHIPIAERLYQNERADLLKNYGAIYVSRYDKSKAHRVFLIIFYSLYQFRNKWVHNGFPFPRKSVIINDKKSRYFGYSVGENLPTKDAIRHVSFNKLNYIDFAELVKQIAPPPPGKHPVDYGNLYILWPTWFFLKDVVRELLRREIKIA